METTPNSKKALYAYFGELGIFTDDVPGHSLYQVGLLNSLSENFGISKFDFYNYLDEDFPSDESERKPIFPDGPIFNVLSSYCSLLIDQYRPTFSTVMSNIAAKKYSKIYLKARFRNISSLTKKLKDARRFELIIEHAISNGYDPKDIIVLDTDLSMSEAFLTRLNELRIKILVPSIDFSPMGKGLLSSVMEIHKNNSKPRDNTLFYYGNLDTTNYKAGHEKNEIIYNILTYAPKEKMFDGRTFDVAIAAKETLKLKSFVAKLDRALIIPRKDRRSIWTVMQNSLVSINVSKDLYIDKMFIPARVYESVILGVIPVSYRTSQHSALYFDTTADFFEICKFLADCSPQEYYKILSDIALAL